LVRDENADGNNNFDLIFDGAKMVNGPPDFN